MKIVPVNQSGDFCTHRISEKYTPEDIVRTLGFESNVYDDPFKVKYSWGFTVDGIRCGIWDYKGSRWSFFGPKEIAEKLFPTK
jgi:hypothetical protein